MTLHMFVYEGMYVTVCMMIGVHTHMYVCVLVCMKFIMKHEKIDQNALSYPQRRMNFSLKTIEASVCRIGSALGGSQNQAQSASFFSFEKSDGAALAQLDQRS